MPPKNKKGEKVMAKVDAIGFKEFRVRYNTEEACSAELFRLRFPDGFIKNIWGKTLQQIVDRYIVFEAKIKCDGYRSYLNLHGVQPEHKKQEIGDLHWLRKVISNLKTFLPRTYHVRCTKLPA